MGNNNVRIEHDALGEVEVPSAARYGAQTQRAVTNFPISGRTLPTKLIHSLGLVKYACAVTNRNLGRLQQAGRRPLSEREVEALVTAAREVAEGMWDDEFPVDVFQTGSGTSSNMNCNEVIATRAVELLERNRDEASESIHPNDHVNMGQSSNDVFPTAIHVAVARAIHLDLIPSLKQCAGTLSDKSDEWSEVIKTGRTHLADATPITLGQEFSGFARQLELAVQRCEYAVNSLMELPIGGTAVGTGLNTHQQFGSRVAEILQRETGLPFKEAANHFEANAQRDALVDAHSQIKTVAVTLFNVSNNIRWLGSGPRCGFHEVSLPELQPGSSIMPGKVNPVLCESAMQVAARVIGNDSTIMLGGVAGGQFQLNVMMPLMADAALESVELLTNVVQLFTTNCLEGMKADAERCEDSVQRSLSLCTKLAASIGYDAASELAHEAMESKRTIHEVCRADGRWSESEVAEMLDPSSMLGPEPDSSGS